MLQSHVAGTSTRKITDIDKTLFDINCHNVAAVLAVLHVFVTLGFRCVEALTAAWELATTSISDQGSASGLSVGSGHSYSGRSSSRIKSTPTRKKALESFASGSLNEVTAKAGEVPPSAMQLNTLVESLTHCIVRMGTDGSTKYGSWIRRICRLFLRYGLVDVEDWTYSPDGKQSPQRGGQGSETDDGNSKLFKSLGRGKSREIVDDEEDAEEGEAGPEVELGQDNGEEPKEFSGQSTLRDLTKKDKQKFRRLCELLEFYLPRMCLLNPDTLGPLVTAVTHSVLVHTLRRWVATLDPKSGIYKDVEIFGQFYGQSLNELKGLISWKIRALKSKDPGPRSVKLSAAPRAASLKGRALGANYIDESNRFSSMRHGFSEIAEAEDQHVDRNENDHRVVDSNQVLEEILNSAKTDPKDFQAISEQIESVTNERMYPLDPVLDATPAQDDIGSKDETALGNSDLRSSRRRPSLGGGGWSRRRPSGSSIPRIDSSGPLSTSKSVLDEGGDETKSNAGPLPIAPSVSRSESIEHIDIEKIDLILPPLPPEQTGSAKSLPEHSNQAPLLDSNGSYVENGRSSENLTTVEEKAGLGAEGEVVVAVVEAVGSERSQVSKNVFASLEEQLNALETSFQQSSAAVLNGDKRTSTTILTPPSEKSRVSYRDIFHHLLFSSDWALRGKDEGQETSTTASLHASVSRSREIYSRQLVMTFFAHWKYIALLLSSSLSAKHVNSRESGFTPVIPSLAQIQESEIDLLEETPEELEGKLVVTVRPMTLSRRKELRNCFRRLDNVCRIYAYDCAWLKWIKNFFDDKEWLEKYLGSRNVGLRSTFVRPSSFISKYLGPDGTPVEATYIDAGRAELGLDQRALEMGVMIPAPSALERYANASNTRGEVDSYADHTGGSNLISDHGGGGGSGDDGSNDDETISTITFSLGVSDSIDFPDANVSIRGKQPAMLKSNHAKKQHENYHIYCTSSESKDMTPTIRLRPEPGDKSRAKKFIQAKPESRMMNRSSGATGRSSGANGRSPERDTKLPPQSGGKLRSGKDTRSSHVGGGVQSQSNGSVDKSVIEDGGEEQRENSTSEILNKSVVSLVGEREEQEPPEKVVLKSNEVSSLDVLRYYVAIPEPVLLT